MEKKWTCSIKFRCKNWTNPLGVIWTYTIKSFQSWRTYVFITIHTALNKFFRWSRQPFTKNQLWSPFAPNFKPPKFNNIQHQQHNWKTVRSAIMSGAANGNVGPPSGTSSTSTESPLLTEVPSSLKQLARLVVRGFYGIEDALIIDMLVRFPCLREEDLAELLKFDKKMLRAKIALLRVDKFVQVDQT